MKRGAIVALLLLIMALPTVMPAKEKAKPVDMKNIKTVYIGWVDVNPEDYHLQGYKSQQEWVNVIKEANLAFQKKCQGLKGLSGRTVTGAKEKGDADAGNSDLYVKFTEVNFDHKYQLHIAVHFLDPKANNELGSIPFKSHGAHFCTLSTCLDKELDEVSSDMEKQLASGASQ